MVVLARVSCHACVRRSAVGILVTFGANVPPLVAKGQVWRLLTASFLHANLLHVAFNVFFQLRMGFGIERRYGYLKFALLYAAAAIYGNLLSAAALFCGTVKVGASTAGKFLPVLPYCMYS